MSECQLTDEGRELVEWFTERVESGGAMPNKHYLVDNGEFAIVAEGDHRIVYKETTAAMTGRTETRMFESGECVVKLMKHPDPWQSRNEIINHEFAPSEIQPFIADVHQWDDAGMWLTMDRAVTPVEPGVQPELLQEFRETGYDPTDIHNDNIGYVGGEPKIIDYGYRFLNPDDEQIGPHWDEFFEQTQKEVEMEEMFA